MRVTILGCGASTGVPALGPDWGRCDPADHRNRRRRCSLLIETAAAAALLIDTSPDLREQFLDARVTRLDAVLLTHAHADHLHGVDDLRMLNRMMKKAIPLYADASTLGEVQQRFGYVLGTPSNGFFARPSLVAHEITGPFAVAGVHVTPFTQDHGFSATLGFRIGGLAYSTDATELDDRAFAAIAGADTWIVDCLRRDPHPTHSHLEKTLAWIRRAQPRRAILTHMDQSLDYRELSAELPPGVEPAIDGLVIDLPEL